MSHRWLCLFFITELILVGLCVGNLRLLRERPLRPFYAENIEQKMVVTSVVDPRLKNIFFAGDTLLTWGGSTITPELSLDFHIFRSGSGDTTNIVVDRYGTAVTVSFQLSPMYSWMYIFSVSTVGLVTWLLALFIVWKRPQNRHAWIAHAALLGMTLTIMTAWEGQTTTTIQQLIGVLFFVGYTISATTLFLFARRFPNEGTSSSTISSVLGLLGFAICTLTIFHHYAAHASPSLGSFLRFRFWFDLFHIVLWSLILAGIVILIIRFHRAKHPEDRKRLQWILWGCAFGLAPFILLTAIPDTFAPKWSVPEEYTMIAFIAVPLSMGVAIVKHNAFDIELVAKRTTAYTFAVVVALGLYILAIAAITPLSDYPPQIAAGLAALVTVLLFEPVRKLAQKFVDRHLFRVQYDFRAASKHLLERIKTSPDLNTLATMVTSQITELIPVQRIGFLVTSDSKAMLTAAAHKGFDILHKHGVQFEIDRFTSTTGRPVSLDSSIELGVPHEVADREVFQRWGLSLVIPILDKNVSPMAFLALGEKKSGARFSSEDVFLLEGVAMQVGLAMERFSLQKKLFAEHVETQRLMELNRLKSDFVSNVSHELRTPLTSIRISAELIDAPGMSDKKSEYVQTIIGETERLNSMVTKVLDSAKMENGALKFHLEPTDLVEIAKRSLLQMQYLLNKQGFKIETTLPSSQVLVYVDPEAIQHVVTNLIENAVKYSPENRCIQLQVVQNKRFGQCSVKDRGRGISELALPHVFDRFYRDASIPAHVQGTGLGLSLAKHIVDSHGGKISVTSKLDEGSEFTFAVPLART